MRLPVVHPRRNALACVLLESHAEGAVAAVTAFVGQLLGNDRSSVSFHLFITVHEILDAQCVDIKAEQQYIYHGDVEEQMLGIEHVDDTKRHKGCDGNRSRPNGALTVLQHREHSAGDGEEHVEDKK